MDLNSVIATAEVIQAAQSTARVARLTAEGDVIYGTARRIAGDTTDVMACALQVTTDQGWEITWPLIELIDEHYAGWFVVNPTEEAP